MCLGLPFGGDSGLEEYRCRYDEDKDALHKFVANKETSKPAQTTPALIGKYS
jgi:hypothetical protein